MNKSNRETVFIIDDDEAVRESLCDLLDSVQIPNRSFASAEEFLGSWSPEDVGCLLLDVRLPGMSGLELQSRVTELGLRLPIIIMTAHGDVPMVRKALKAGAMEFLTKPFQDEELFEALREALERDRANRRTEGEMTAIQMRMQQLTEREHQVLELVATGLTNKEIGDRLHLSIVTIKLYRGQLMKKMCAHSLADLVRMWEKMSNDRTRNSSF